VTPGDFKGRILQTSREFVSEKGVTEGRARIVPPRSVLVVCIGATIGNVAIAGTLMAINQQINALSFNHEMVDSEYGYWACRALYSQIFENASKATLPILNRGRFSQLEIPVPTLDLQKQIAEKMNEADDILKLIVGEFQNTLEKVSFLEQSILHKAFAGEL